MADGLAKTLAGVLGFGLCKTALGVAYLTAMGSVFSNVGFISELSFMTPMLVASLATASLIVLGARRGRLSPGFPKEWQKRWIQSRERNFPRRLLLPLIQKQNQSLEDIFDTY